MIDILLSTFNSNKYLEEQINSLLNQTYTYWSLIIRDDGSTDNTLNYLKELKERFPSKVTLFIENENIGVVKSFESLVLNSTADYIMFCDHDDIWLPNKIEQTLSKMKNMESMHPNLPILVHTDLTVVDETFETIHDSFWKFSKLNPTLLSNFNYLGVCNGITGCTVMINRKAKEVSIPFSKNTRMHDWWIGLCVSKFGKIGFIVESTILYRQHEGNQIGATEIKNSFNYVNSRILSIKKVIRDNKKQLSLIKELKYGSCIKYLYYKTCYFFKVRI